MRFSVYKLLCLAIIITAGSCTKNEPDTGNEPGIAAETRLNVSYGTDPLQKMDIYLPEGRTTASTKLLILIHGGSWIGGDKNDHNIMIQQLKDSLPDFAIANINYRLAGLGVNLFPTQENDVKAGIEYLYSQRETLKFSDKFALTGFSAGGHLALLQGYKHTSPVKVKAIADFFGPADMADMYNNPASNDVPGIIIALLFGGKTPNTHPDDYKASSPIQYVTASSPPTIIFHGGKDLTVRPAQSEALHQKLLASNVKTKYVYYANEGHGWEGANYLDSFKNLVAFLKENVK